MRPARKDHGELMRLKKWRCHMAACFFELLKWARNGEIYSARPAFRPNFGPRSARFN